MVSPIRRAEDEGAAIATSPVISNPSNREQQHGGLKQQDLIEVELDVQSSNAPSKHGLDTSPPQQPTSWFHWHEPGTSPEEKKLVFKLD
jgi:hypothetical protein